MAKKAKKLAKKAIQKVVEVLSKNYRGKGFKFEYTWKYGWDGVENAIGITANNGNTGYFAKNYFYIRIKMFFD